MDENDDLGRYVQARLREKNIEDKAVAKLLNISVKTVPKIYHLKAIHSDRLAKLSTLIGEDIYLDFYGNKEPLRTLLNREKIELTDDLERVRSEHEESKKVVKLLNDQLIEQNNQIRELHKEIIEKSNQILEILKGKKQ